MAEKIDLNKIIDLAGIKAGFSELENLLKDAAAQAAIFGQAMSAAKTDASKDLSKLRDEIARLNAELAKQNPSTKQGQQAIDALGGSIASTGRDYEKAAQSAKEYELATKAVDASLDDVKKQLKEAKKDFAAINQVANPKEFEEAAKKVRELSAQQKALRDQLKLSTTSTKENKKETKAAAGSLEDITARLKEAKKAFSAVSEAADPSAFAQAAQKVQLLSSEQKRLRDQLKATSRSLGGINENLKFNENSYNAIRANIKKYKAELGDAEVGTRDYMRTEAKLNAELEKEIAIRERQPSLLAKRIRQAAGESKEVKVLSDRLRELRKNLVNAPSDSVFDDISKDIKKVEGDIDSLMSKQKKGGGGAGGGDGGGLLSQVFGGIVQGGAAGVAMAGVELLVDGITALASEIAEITPQLRMLQTLTGQTGDQLADTAGTVRGIAETYGREFDEIAIAANTLSKEFGGDFADSALAVADALAFDVTGEAIDSIKEYSTQIKGLGGTQEDMIKLAQLQGREGFYSDKFFDAVKEGGLRLGELTTGGKEALAALGDTGKEVQKLFAEGEQFKAIQLLSRETANLAKEGKNVQPIIANLFGGAGEDLGVRGLELLGNLSEVNLELTDLQQQQKDILDSRIAYEQSLTSLASEFTNTGSSFTVFFNKIKTFGIDLLVDLSKFFNEIGGDLKRIFDYFGAGNSTIGDIISKMMSFIPIVTLIKVQFNLLGGYVRGLIGTYKRLIAFGAALNKSLGDPLTRIVRGISDLWGTLTTSVSGFEVSMTDSFKAFKQSAKDAVTFVVKKVFEAVEFLREKFDFISALIPDDFEKKARAKFAGFKAEFDKVLAELNAEDPPEVKVKVKVDEDAGTGLNEELAGLKLKPIKVEIAPEIPVVSEIENNTNLGVKETERELGDIEQLQKENAERVAANTAIVEAAAEQKRLERRKKHEETAAQFGQALASKTEEKLAEGTNRRFDRRRELLEAQGASQEVLDRLEKKRQRRLAQQQILSATIRAGVEGFIAALKSGKTPAEAASAGVQAGGIAGGIASVAAFEAGGLVRGPEQLVRINEKGQEFVINAETTRKHLPMLEALNAGNFSPSLAPIMGEQARTLERPQKASIQSHVIDYDRLGRAVAKYTPKTDLYEEASRIVLSEQTASKVRKIEIARSSIMPKFGSK